MLPEDVGTWSRMLLRIVSEISTASKIETCYSVQRILGMRIVVGSSPLRDYFFKVNVTRFFFPPVLEGFLLSLVRLPLVRVLAILLTFISNNFLFKFNSCLSALFLNTAKHVGGWHCNATYTKEELYRENYKCWKTHSLAKLLQIY